MVNVKKYISMLSFFQIWAKKNWALNCLFIQFSGLAREFTQIRKANTSFLHYSEVAVAGSKCHSMETQTDVCITNIKD